MTTLRIPPPGIDGTYKGSCVACFRGTDTGLGFNGEAEWAMAGLTKLGIPMNQACATVEYALGGDPKAGTVPAGRHQLVFRVCADCAARGGLLVGPVVAGQVPGYHQPEEVK